MAEREFSPERIARCKAAMSKSGPLSALRLIASGRVLVEVRQDECYIDTFDGRTVRDEDHPDCKMGLAGSWPLHAAGMIDCFGVVTRLGRLHLAQHAARPNSPVQP